MVKTQPQPGIHNLNQTQNWVGIGTRSMGPTTGIHNLNHSHRTTSALKLGQWITGIHNLSQSHTIATHASANHRQVYVPANQKHTKTKI